MYGLIKSILRTRLTIATAVLLACLSLPAPAADDDAAQARKLIAQVQDEIISRLVYTDAELSKFKEDFHAIFRQAAQRAQIMAEKLHSDAIRWLDPELTYWLADGERLLLFWSDGLWDVDSGSGYGRDFIAALVAKDEQARLVAVHIIDEEFSQDCSGTNGVCRWKQGCFWQLRDPGTSTPDQALIRYLKTGASGSSYVYHAIGYNRYSDSVEISTFTVPWTMDLRPANTSVSQCTP